MQRVELERTLTDSQRDEFEDMLRALTLERSQIKDAMGFSLDNADAAGEVCILCVQHWGSKLVAVVNQCGFADMKIMVSVP